MTMCKVILKAGVIKYIPTSATCAKVCLFLRQRFFAGASNCAKNYYEVARNGLS